MSMNLKSPKDKYLNDPQYAQLVDTLESWIHLCEFTPSEIRQAALLACINYEMRHLRTPFVIDPKVEEAIETIRAFENKEE